jgi:DNA invertase Pin-like site-specific DNA recombinase
MPEDRPHQDRRRLLEARRMEARMEARKEARLARELADARRALIRSLLDEGVSQSAIARRLGVSRQAVQRLLLG